MDLVEMRKSFVVEQQASAAIYTAHMGTPLGNMAARSVESIVKQIYDKAIEKWNRCQTANSIDDMAERMKQSLQEEVLKHKKEGKELTPLGFEEYIRILVEKTRIRIHREFIRGEDALV